CARWSIEIAPFDVW
nr:immunoglobulin heavy chain junction region [Macaca mulatta]MOV48234.1 immunoglobulin heavy chain junction region [Macaca mulatta]MOV48292.1 immunoglobulin heavy chain junction region [Macaca mulatta]MOV48592.1 immunoglobulin heavy chain junction region [Macaca mulatta]MOV48782.1 immunoglobulin heavy chain junction region [Macaca mulatta]